MRRFLLATEAGSKAEKGAPTLGTAAVFLTTISTILGAILFLRLGYAVANVGVIGALAIILIGHLVTVPTAMAIAEIATNQRVEGGGVYYMISRSFGLVIGGAVGAGLYLSQAISIAFYVIAFAQAFSPVFDYLGSAYGIAAMDLRVVSIPTMALLAVLILTRGAIGGITALYVVVGVLFLSIGMFLGGKAPFGFSPERFLLHVDRPDGFFYVFAICFPAFTGLTAGVGLSGDLRNPRRAIPVGTLLAVLVGMAVYVLAVLKLSVTAGPEDLAADQLIMSRIVAWGPIIPIGLACASLSSALGSVMVAPRTLQALAADGLLPTAAANAWLGATNARTNEPARASLLTLLLATFFVVIGDIDFVAAIISMFFMVTYGAICLISFLEHFAADPSYRPTFRSRWYVSLVGALLCLWLMFEMSAFYAALALVLLFWLYRAVRSYSEDKRGLASLVQGAIFQISRRLQVFLQRSMKGSEDLNWRPAVVCLSDASFTRLGAFELLRWISHRYGFATYIHFIQGYLSRASSLEAKQTLQRLIQLVNVSGSNIYVDTMVSPSYTSGVTQLIQLPGITGKENNLIVFEFWKETPEDLARIVEHYQLAVATGFDVCILGTSSRNFGYRREIHLWITPEDFANASLMILLAYIISAHPDWRGGAIKIFAIFPEDEADSRKRELLSLVKSGRLPISAKNIEVIAQREGMVKKAIVNERSNMADLTILGFRGEVIRRLGDEVFKGYDGVGDVLFVNTLKEIEIERTLEGPAAEPEGEKQTAAEAAGSAARAAEKQAPEQTVKPEDGEN